MKIIFFLLQHLSRIFYGYYVDIILRRKPFKLRLGIIKFYDIVLPLYAMCAICAASFNSRSLVYGCSTLMHASRYACNERAEERVKVDMRVRGYVCAYGHRVEIVATYSERNFRLHPTTLSVRKFENKRIWLHPKEMLAQSQNFYRKLCVFYVYTIWKKMLLKWQDAWLSRSF